MLQDVDAFFVAVAAERAVAARRDDRVGPMVVGASRSRPSSVTGRAGLASAADHLAGRVRFLAAGCSNRGRGEEGVPALSALPGLPPAAHRRAG